MTAQSFPQSSTYIPRVKSTNPQDLIDAAESRATFWKYPPTADCSVALQDGNKPITAKRLQGVWSFR